MKVFSIRALDHVGHGAAAVVIILMTGMLYAASTVAWRSIQLVAHAASQFDDVSGLGESFSRAKAAQRGFLLSAEERFIASRDAAFADIGLRIGRLKALDSGSPQGLARLEALERQLGERFALMVEDERARRARPVSGTAAPAAHELHYDVGTITTLLGELRSRELAAVEARRMDQQRAFMRAGWSAAVVLVLSVALMIIAYLASRRRSRARDAAEKKLVEITESLPGAVFQLRTQPDGRSRFEFLSSGIKLLRGVDREAVMKDPGIILGAILESDREPYFEARAAAQKAGVPLEHDFRIKCANGEIRWLRASAAPAPQPDGSVVWTGHWVDVTEGLMTRRALLESKEAAEAANRAKTTFVTTMSHEIRTPMTGVLGMLELIARTELDAEQRAMLQIVQDSGSSLLRVVDDILDFSKIEAGKLELAPEPTSIAKVVECVFGIHSGIARNKGLALTRSVDARIGASLMVDPLRLRQILGNLVSNAVKFTSSGEVEIRADLVDRNQTGDVVRFSVRDTGVGIPFEAQKRLFRPYAQVFAGSAHQYGGTGLGLAICQKLATLMGGAVGVVSSPGKGTVMMLTVPLRLSLEPPSHAASDAPEEPGAAHRAAPAPEVAQAEGTLMLLVDDHPVNRMILARQVNMLGYAAETAANGLEALDLWRSGRFAAVITDCDMPGMNGYELARSIRSIEATSGLARMPIIACTAYAILGEAQHCLDAGMDDYLSKPLDLKRLARTLGKWLPLPARIVAPAARSGDCAAGPIDTEALGETSGGDRATERELLLRFESCNDDDTDVLRRAIAQSNLLEVRHVAHRMKGAGRMIGAVALADACERIERAARADDAHGVASSVPSLDHELERLRQYLKTL